MCGCPRAATIDDGDDDGDHDDGSGDDVGEDDDDRGDRSSGGLPPRHTHAVHDWGARVESSRTVYLPLAVLARTIQTSLTHARLAQTTQPNTC